MARSGFLCEILCLKRKASVLFAEGLLPDVFCSPLFPSGRIRMSSNFSILEMVAAVLCSRFAKPESRFRNGDIKNQPRFAARLMNLFSIIEREGVGEVKAVA